MTKSVFACGALAAMLLFAAPLAAAAADAGAQTQKPTEDRAAASNPTAPASFSSAKISLPQAIAAGEKRLGGGKCIDVNFDENGGRPAYRMRIWHDKAVWEGLIDANTGEAIGEGTTTAEDKLDADDKAELAELEKAKISLDDAIKDAERQGEGKAIDAGLDERDGKTVYDVEVVTNGIIHEVLIDPATGEATDAGSIEPAGPTSK